MQSLFRAYNALRTVAGRARVALSRRARAPLMCLSLSDRALFVEQLSYLLKANLPLADSVRLVHSQSSARMAAFLDAILFDIDNGKPLHDSLSRSCASFSSFDITMIRIGEDCGMLGANLESLATNFKKRAALRSSIAGALVYPAVIVSALAIVASVLAFYLFPKILPIVKSLRLELPLSTQILIGAYATWERFHWHIGLAIAGIIGFASRAQRWEPMRVHRDALCTAAPLLGPLIVQYECSIACRILGLMLSRGMAIPDAVDICRLTTQNRCYASAFSAIRRRLASGETLSSNLHQFPRLFPVIIPHMASVGEEAGSLPTILLSLAERMESLVEEQAKLFARSLEPALMLLLGLIIGFIATAIITPFYAITQQLNRL